MKKYVGLLVSFFLLGVFCSCEEDWNPDELVKNSVGELSLSELNLIFEGDDNEIDQSHYILSILNSRDSVVAECELQDKPLAISLEVGVYTLEVASHDAKTVDWERPFYKGSRAFVIKEEETTAIKNVQCKKASIAVQIKYADELYPLVDPTSIVSIEANDTCQVVFTKDETRVAHMLLPDGNTTLVAKFSGIVDGDTINNERIITDVYSENAVMLEYTIDDLVQAPTIDPANAPTISSETLNLSGVNVITSDLVAKVDINAPYGIENFNVKIISDQLTKEELQGVGLDSEFDLANPGDLATALNDLGFPTGDQVKGKTQMQFDITMFMEVLALFEGVHQFELTVVDIYGLSTVAKLVFEAKPIIDPANAPTITSETLNLSGVNVITSDLIAKVDINAPYGIENFNVKIISDQLTKEELQGVGLDSEFDLANPGDLAVALNDLGFPTGDQVKGMTQMQFDITIFMEVLALFEGVHKFELTITDEKGLSTTSTLTFEAPSAVDPNSPTVSSETLNLNGINVITSDLVARVDINAPNGIENFSVKIISDQLTKEELQGVGLDSEFDLANPGDLAAALNDLGFPTGDQVKGKTQMQFDITIFMEVLALFQGVHHFELTIVDAQGLTTSATLSFQAL